MLREALEFYPFFILFSFKTITIDNEWSERLLDVEGSITKHTICKVSFGYRDKIMSLGTNPHPILEIPIAMKKQHLVKWEGGESGSLQLAFIKRESIVNQAFTVWFLLLL